MGTQEVVGILIAITALASYINHKLVKLPKSIGITLITLLLSLLMIAGDKFGLNITAFSSSFLQRISFNETFMHGILSFLLFAGALHVNVMELSKQKALIALLATVSVIISTFIVGYGTYIVVKFFGINLPLLYCLAFGALISPTDPIAVLGILKQVKAPKSLEVKIAGEALFNDGMGIVLFFVILAVASSGEGAFSMQAISWYFVQQGIGGILAGATIGWLVAKLLRTVDDPDIAIMLTLAVVTGGYTLSHSVLHVSGPISMAVAGLVIGSYLKETLMSRSSLKNLAHFWELLDEVLNGILFVLIGLEFLRIKFDLRTSLASLGVIIIVIVARWISIAIPVASLSAFRKFSHGIITIMTWGGLRGGISISLALSIQSPYHNSIIAITYAVVLFSMVVQGLTVGLLVKKYTLERGSRA